MTLWYIYWLKAGKQWIRKAAKLEIAIQLIHLFEVLFWKNNIRYREAIIVNGEVNLNMVFDNMLIWYFSPQNTKVEARRQTVRNISKSFLFLNVVREDGYSLQYRAIRYKWWMILVSNLHCNLFLVGLANHKTLSDN